MLGYSPLRIVAAVCLCGVAASAQTAGVWLDVPFVKQEKNGCGAASLAMVMQYWQKQAGEVAEEASSEAAIQSALYAPRAGGIYASQMESYLKQHGFRAFAFAGKWEDLQHHLARGRPLIVALKPPHNQGQLHYVVVAGLDPAANVVLVNDAAQRKLLSEERATFEKDWSAAGNWTLLALPQAAK